MRSRHLVCVAATTITAACVDSIFGRRSLTFEKAQRRKRCYSFLTATIKPVRFSLVFVCIRLVLLSSLSHSSLSAPPAVSHNCEAELCIYMECVHQHRSFLYLKQSLDRTVTSGIRDSSSTVRRRGERWLLLGTILDSWSIYLSYFCSSFHNELPFPSFVWS